MGCWALDKKKALKAVQWIEKLKDKLYHVVGDDAVFDRLNDVLDCIFTVILLNEVSMTDTYLKKHEDDIEIAIKQIEKDYKKGFYEKKHMNNVLLVKKRLKALKKTPK